MASLAALIASLVSLPVQAQATAPDTPPEPKPGSSAPPVTAPSPSTPTPTSPPSPPPPPPPSTPGKPPSAPQAQSIVITGNPLRQPRGAAAVSVIDGDALLLQRGATIADALAGEPSIAGTWFGPHANRPTIRGMDGDRIRVLNNSGASLDASSLSDDHALAMDALVVERIEVLRGPAALLYGGSAVGGVINVIDNRIPQARLQGPSGAVETRLGGATQERAASALLEGGQGNVAWHLDAFARRTSDLTVPRYLRPVDDAGSTQAFTRVPNSAGRTAGAAIGASWVGERVTFGLSTEGYSNRYGSIADEAVTIDMKRQRTAFKGEWTNPFAGVSAVRWQGASARYEHREIEREASTGLESVGTVFSNRGADTRLEVAHAPVAHRDITLTGVVGGQLEANRFSAVGAEAFVPSTRTRQGAVFVLETLTFDGVAKGMELSLGWREERVEVLCRDAGSDAPGCRFGIERRRVAPRSTGMGVTHAWTPNWLGSINATKTQRAPTSTELFAQGVHVATAAYERGDPTLGVECSHHVEGALEWRASNAPASKAVADTDGEHPTRVRLSAWRAQFRNLVSLRATGSNATNNQGATVPIYAFEARPAQLQGVELEGRTAWAGRDAAQWGLDVKASVVRGVDRATLEPLPRLAPFSVRAELSWSAGAWTLKAQTQHSGAQTRVPVNDSITPAWTMWSGSVMHRTRIGGVDARVFVKLDNLGNALAYNATTLATVRGLAPLPGRSARIGVRMDW